MFSHTERIDDRGMTAQPSVPRRLHRRSDERVIAGVASGLGEYFNVDPLLIRIALVASLVFGGLGLFLYAAAWLLVPEDSEERSIAERIFGGAALGGGLAGAIVVVVAILVILGILSAIFGGISNGGEGALFLAVAIGIAGVLLLRRGSPEPIATASAATASSATDPGAAPTAAIAAPVVRRQPRPPSPLGWYVLGAALIGIGAMALAGTAWDVAFEPGTYAGVVLGVIGVGLLVGAWFGHARFLIVIGLLLLPFAWAASLIDVPIQGGWGQQRHAPSAVSELREEYRLAGGQLTLDLSGLELGSEPVTIGASVAMGQLTVLVPDGASLDIEASVGGGTLRLLDGPFDEGTYLQDHAVVGAGEPDIILDLEAGIGAIRVDSRITEDR
jgi:phage shock protein PspC (stress-responsive transcriptional regulator)